MKKVLWKIETLWQKYFHITAQNIDIPIAKNYDGGISKYYSRFYHVDSFDFSPSQVPVFSDDYGRYHGLEKLQVLTSSQQPIYLFDNHNEMIYPLVEISELTGTQYDIVHIDAHRDDALFAKEKPQHLSLEEVGNFISETRISDFFDAISETNMIQNIYRVCDSVAFENFKIPQKPFILSLDIDIFGPEGNFVDLETRVRVIAETWGHADAICIATSPGFIDQEFAKGVVEVFVK